ncbi:basic amino acid ABC transporter substrate-binding protein [Hazenella coriacea]|uniref:Amino acid ABC transporter substrate-binding protein (PAAT family) n=1 Tax=Hazenella coriacea TaxID=1179467 RepID=A0A4V2UVG2_9BACL|nr:basic amino acid ABC transporter substrate-binding protein [Hazenella coriacea]TCS95647.1 amino acid ABC transporter substrate-binding protein (PAAT family) [Hazenella coriacea]
MKKIWWLSLSAILILSLALSGCASSDDGKKKIVFGTDAAFPPFEKLEGDGKITGFDADILQAVAKASGLQIELQHLGWEGMFAGIERGKVDGAIAAITMDENRKKKYNFTDSYFEATQVILVPSQSSIQSLKDLQGKKIGVLSASSGELVVHKHFGKTYEGLKGYEDFPSTVEDMTFGRTDAVVADNAVAMEYLKKIGSDKFKIIEDPQVEKEQYGILVKKGNDELLKQLNDGLAKIKADGTYDQIYEKYFGKKK